MQQPWAIFMQLRAALNCCVNAAIPALRVACGLLLRLRGDPTFDDAPFLAQRRSDLLNGLPMPAKTPRQLSLFAYIAFLLALSAGGRAVFGLVSARNKGQLTALAQPSRQAEDD